LHGQNLLSYRYENFEEKQFLLKRIVRKIKIQ